MSRQKVSTFQHRINELLDGKYKDRIEAFKNKDRISLEDFSKAIDCGARQVVGKWSTGENKYPQPQSLEKISDAYNVSIDWLLGYDDAPDRKQQDEYAVFNKYGFDLNFYETLREMKEQPYSDYADIIKGLNILFTDKDIIDLETIKGNTTCVSLNTLGAISKLLHREPLINSRIIRTEDINHIFSILDNNAFYKEDIKENYNPHIAYDTVHKTIYNILCNTIGIDMELIDTSYLNNIQISLRGLKAKLDDEFIKSFKVDDNTEIPF